MLELRSAPCCAEGVHLLHQVFGLGLELHVLPAVDALHFSIEVVHQAEVWFVEIGWCCVEGAAAPWDGADISAGGDISGGVVRLAKHEMEGDARCKLA